MSGRFSYKPFAEINLNDPFFDSLKNDYPEFESTWFPKCVRQNREALVFSDENGLGAFVAMKEECEEIVLRECTLPAINRLKISTLRLAERFRGQRLGEGALGLILWKWQDLKLPEVYVTVFPTHDDLITQLEKFGFMAQGYNDRGELVYLRSRNQIDFCDPYKAFPFISPDFAKGGYLIVEDTYHDTLFPYSELQNTWQEQLDRDAANGISKVYIGQQYQTHYQSGEPIFIYRKYNGPGARKYKSCVTSYCVVDRVIPVKRSGRVLMSFETLCQIVGNKSVFSIEDLRNRYQTNSNVTVVKLLYCGYFGKGNNVNYAWLDEQGLWAPHGEYPAQTQLSPEQCAMIWRHATIDVENVLGR